MSNIIDGIVGALMLFVFVITCAAAFMIFNAIDGTGFFGGYSESFGGFFEALNNTFIFIAIAISAVPIISALFIRTHPVFFIVSLLMIFVQGILTPIFVNTYNSVMQEMPASTQNGLALQIQIMQILPLITIVGAFLAAIVGLMRE